MAHFGHINSFVDLKIQFRTLAKANHPDKGGDVEIMQEINAEFSKLYKIWELRKDTAPTYTGYENDNSGATAEQYADCVYNEYRWTGSRYKRQGNQEILDLIRKWLNETYPSYKFSVTRRHHTSFVISLIHADFEVFKEEYVGRAYHDVSRYNIDGDKYITDRAKEVMSNVCSYIISYNYDDSDAMTDYFNTNFYLDLNIGTSEKPYKVVLPQLGCAKSKLEPQFKHPEGAAHKAIRQALKGAVFQAYGVRSGTRIVLGEISFHQDGTQSFYPKYYGGYKTALKRYNKLIAAGIDCKIEDSVIVFNAYTPETFTAIERERQEWGEAKKTWDEAQANPIVKPAPKTKAASKTTKAQQSSVEPIKVEGIELVDDYSEKAFAIIGDTKPIKDTLKKLGGSFNFRLKCGAGWIFSKTKLDIVKETLAIT